MSFKAFMKKEWMETIRDNRLIVLVMGFLFTAVSTPPLLKLLPDILASELGTDLTELIQFSALDSVSNFLVSNFSQVSILVLCLSLAGVLCDEISKCNIVLPLSKGANRTGVVLSKYCFYSILTFVITMISTIIGIYYSYLVFESDFPKFSNILLSCVYVCLYAQFILSLIFLFSSFLKKGAIVALIPMGINVVLSLFVKAEYTISPFTLISEASKLGGDIITPTILITSIMCILSLIASICIFNKQELNA